MVPTSSWKRSSAALGIGFPGLGAGTSLSVAVELHADRSGVIQYWNRGAERLIATNGGRVALDLGEVTLVDRTVVERLVRWEREGVALRACPAWMREWIFRESEGRA